MREARNNAKVWFSEVMETRRGNLEVKPIKYVNREQQGVLEAAHQTTDGFNAERKEEKFHEKTQRQTNLF